MPQRDTSIAIYKLFINPKWWGRSGALNARQGYKPSYQQAMYKSQMIGMIWPAYQNKVSVYQQALDIDPKLTWDNPTCL